MIATLLICMVVSVSDGDSLTVRCGPPDALQPRQVRIHAIDAPEHYQAFSDPSRSSLAALCLHARARIRPLEVDSYGRTIGQVECRGEDVAAHQVRSGMAWVYTRYASTRPDLLALQEQARLARWGLWADPQPVAPWVWRRRSGAPFRRGALSSSRLRTLLRCCAPDRASKAPPRVW
ncbi:MAG: thermonuclease family protein [Comamonas sp.]